MPTRSTSWASCGRSAARPPAAPIARRWSGIYAESTTDELVHRAAPDPQLWVVTGPCGRGMTLGPALAEQTADQLEL